VETEVGVDMRCVRRWVRVLVTAGLVTGLPLAAGALAILPDPVLIDHPGGTQATLELVEVVNGLPVGGVAPIGIVSPGSLTLVFRARIEPGSPAADAGLEIAILDLLGVALPYAAQGYVPGTDADWSILGGSGGVATFVPGSPPLAGSVFDPVFLSYDVPLATDASLELGARFGLGAGGGTALIVPEPATGHCFALGLAGLSLARRRARRDA
jgi:hypothetical protein